MADNQLKTGIAELDALLSGKGIPKGELNMIYGRADVEGMRSHMRTMLQAKAKKEGRVLVEIDLELPPDKRFTP
jgi:KaiC/GvpD/RAD55 family RecA-like ATPase